MARSIGHVLGDALAGYRDRDNKRCVTALCEALDMVRDVARLRAQVEAGRKLAEACEVYDGSDGALLGCLYCKVPIKLTVRGKTNYAHAPDCPVAAFLALATPPSADGKGE